MRLRDLAASGGLMSYGASIDEMFRRAGNYAGKILKGAKPADLPVEQPTKFELVHQSQDREGARPDVPTALLVRADEVIE